MYYTLVLYFKFDLYRILSICQQYHGENKLFFEKMMSVLCRSTCSVGFLFCYLWHWNNRKYVAPLWPIFLTFSLCFYSKIMCASEEETHTKFIVFGLTLPKFKLMISCTGGNNANHYTIKVVLTSCARLS